MERDSERVNIERTPLGELRSVAVTAQFERRGRRQPWSLASIT
jgi:hypothetical protein